MSAGPGPDEVAAGLGPAEAAALDEARRVADAVLYEGYVLYPYRASAGKNQLRWQFGVLVPPAFAGERSASRTECLLEPGAGGVRVEVRFLQVVRRTVEAADGPGDGDGQGFRPAAELEVDGTPLVPWDEGRAVAVAAMFPVGAVADREQVVAIEVPGGEEHEPVRDAGGRVRARYVRTRWPLRGQVRLSAVPVSGPYGVLRLRLDVQNDTPEVASGSEPFNRDAALRHALVAAHALVAVDDGAFLSLRDPPEWARPAAEACVNDGVWPVLVGPEQRPRVLLSSPIILDDFPRVAPESPGDLYDATEIDEILTLRTMALTDAEKRAARATDERAAAVLDRTDAMPAEVLERLHGAVRYLREVTAPGAGLPALEPEQAAPERTPWWDPGADRSVSPDTDAVVVGGARVARGSRVRLTPGRHRADAQDLFLAGRAAVVQAVLRDVDDVTYLAVTLEGDPGAELEIAQGRFRYFRPDEVEPL